MTIYDADINLLDGTAADLHDYEGKAVARRERGLEVRAHPAVRGPRAAPEDATATRASPSSASRATSSSARSRAPPRRSPRSARPPTASPSRSFEKIDVNGDDRHPLYAELTQVADADGDAGDIQWNFEKFLVAPDGEVVARFRPDRRARDPRARRGHRGQPPRLTSGRSGRAACAAPPWCERVSSRPAVGSGAYHLVREVHR